MAMNFLNTIGSFFDGKPGNVFSDAFGGGPQTPSGQNDGQIQVNPNALPSASAFQGATSLADLFRIIKGGGGTAQPGPLQNPMGGGFFDGVAGNIQAGMAPPAMPDMSQKKGGGLLSKLMSAFSGGAG